MEQILKILDFIVDSFVHMWPYLLITIPFSAVIQVSGAAKYVQKIFKKNIIIAIFLATVAGAFSPFCSCGVIPVIMALLISGVPLAPVMSFWIASPSMDPEIFFLSVATVGWELSVWRLAATFLISLSAGFITHIAYKSGFLGTDILRSTKPRMIKRPLKVIVLKYIRKLKPIFVVNKNVGISAQIIKKSNSGYMSETCCLTVDYEDKIISEMQNNTDNVCTDCSHADEKPMSFREKLLKEIRKTTFIVVKFMALAFFINALIQIYVPKDLISRATGGNGFLSVITASLIGIPVYTSNITALPLIGGLITLGMNKGAALAFLIAGPTTTLPAMAAVWGITKRKVFLLYVSFSLFGAMLFGLLYNLSG